MSNERIAFARARDLTRVGDGGGVDDENIPVHSIPRAQAPAWLMQKYAAGFELDLTLWAGLWMIEHNPDASAADSAGFLLLQDRLQPRASACCPASDTVGRNPPYRRTPPSTNPPSRASTATPS